MKRIGFTLLAMLMASAVAADTAQAQALPARHHEQAAMERFEFEQPGPLTAAVSREAARLAGERPAGVCATRASASQSGQPSGNWIKRHPVWFGTIVGAIAGAAIVGAASGAEAAFVGFWGGAAIGAVTGAILGR